jgi:SAM-dependent methyltransferase
MKNLLRKFLFRIWYFRNPPWDTNKTPPEVIDFIAQNPPGKALDLGCGTGTNVITLVKNGWQATGVDFIPKAIRTAKLKTAREKVNARFFVGNVTNLEWIEDQFNLILDIGCYHSLDSNGRRDYRDNIKRLLAPGGTYLVYLFYKSDPTIAGSGVTQMDIEAFSNFLELVNRQDGTERGLRKSSWLTYHMTRKRQSADQGEI